MAAELPKISLITPSLNQGKYIERTILSVLSQNYPHLEYIIIDGGSSDNTRSVLKKYSSRLKWISEKDKGQSDAINKGIRRSSGEIIGYLNSDDYLLVGSLTKIGRFFSKNKKALWVTGKCRIVDASGREVRKLITGYKNFYLKYCRFREIFLIIQFISQPSTFWRRQLIDEVGFFDEELHYDMDYDYWLRIWQKYPLYYLDECLSCYRVHHGAKASLSPETQFSLEYSLARKFTSNKLLLFLHYLHSRLSLFVYRFL